MPILGVSSTNYGNHTLVAGNVTGASLVTQEQLHESAQPAQSTQNEQDSTEFTYEEKSEITEQVNSNIEDDLSSYNLYPTDYDSLIFPDKKYRENGFDCYEYSQLDGGTITVKKEHQDIFGNIAAIFDCTNQEVFVECRNKSNNLIKTTHYDKNGNWDVTTYNKDNSLKAKAESSIIDFNRGFGLTGLLFDNICDETKPMPIATITTTEYDNDGNYSVTKTNYGTCGKNDKGEIQYYKEVKSQDYYDSNGKKQYQTATALLAAGIFIYKTLNNNN